MRPQLVIGNKNYSSWSLRPWLAARHAGKPGDALMLDAILITVGIVVAACSVSYKLLLLMYRPTPEGRTQAPTTADATAPRRT